MGNSTTANKMLTSAAEIVANRVDRELVIDARTPAADWKRALPVSFSRDWRGNSPNPDLATSVRVLWSDLNLFVRFECRYRELFCFPGSDPNGRRDHLWDRDVAEAFLQPNPESEGYYKEFEVSPNGMWVDLDIFPGGRSDLKSGLQRSVLLDESRHLWTAELKIPIHSVAPSFDPRQVWRANFYRVEGAKEPRTYMAWQPTGTEEPNFHVPRAFGRLRFEM